jgi:hypothetical protein
MSNAKYEIPEGMAMAARHAYEAWKSYASPEEQYTNGAVAAVVAAIHWLADNPIVPSDDEALEIYSTTPNNECCDLTKQIAVKWQRRMFLTRDTTPEELKPYLWKANPFPNNGIETSHDESVKAAFNLGKKAGSK